MKKETPIIPTLMYRLKGLSARVVQKGNVGGKYIYALQRVRSNIVVNRAKAKGENVTYNPANAMTIKNGEHTQTWEYAGDGQWFVGVNPKDDRFSHFKWTTQIARVKFAAGKSYRYTQLPRLAHLYEASSDDSYTQEKMQRVEAAVSQDYKYLLIQSLQYPVSRGKPQTAHFALYDLDEVNDVLDEAAKKKSKYVGLENLHKLMAFTIPNFKPAIPSLQGIDLYVNPDADKDNLQDSDITLYVSCELPVKHKNGEYVSSDPRQIVKVPWGETDPAAWHAFKLENSHWENWATEVEGLQVVGPDIYLTVAYHSKTTGKTTQNRIYRVSGIMD